MFSLIAAGFVEKTIGKQIIYTGGNAKRIGIALDSFTGIALIVLAILKHSSRIGVILGVCGGLQHASLLEVLRTAIIGCKNGQTKESFLIRYQPCC